MKIPNALRTLLSINELFALVLLGIAVESELVKALCILGCGLNLYELYRISNKGRE